MAYMPFNLGYFEHELYEFLTAQYIYSQTPIIAKFNYGFINV